MKQKYILLILLVIIIFTTSLSVLAVTPNIELTPPTQSVNQGTQATIEVVVEDVTDLKGANIILNFDASKLQYNSSADGGFIPGALLAPPTVDNTNGSVTLDLAGTSHASGTGTIMSVTFDTIGAGDSSITFGTTTLKDKDNLIIDHSIGSGCLVTVNAELTEITVLPETMTLFVGEDRTITSITASYNYGPDKTIALADCTYNSDTTTVATVSTSGEITAIDPGTATITVTYTEGVITKTDTLEVTVNPIQLTSIVVLPETMNLLKGDSETIISIVAHYNDGAAAEKSLADCTYSSDNKSIATVAVGVITAVGAGTATITVSYTEGGITRTDTVVVTVNAKLTEITVLPETMTLFVGEERTITSITASYNYGPDKTIALGDCTYSSDNESVATVAVGVVTTVDPGTATITVTYIEGGIIKNDTLEVTVNPIQLTSIVVLPETMTLFKGDSDTITSITIHYNNGDTASIALADCSYSSYDESIATVAVGVITAVEAGTATIIVTYTEGGITKTDIIEITVIPVPNLKLTPLSQSVNQGGQATIDIVVEDVINLKGASITLNFEASKLQYSSSVAGGFIPGAFLTPPTVDNTNGTVTLDLASLSSNASGTGTIMTVTFDTIEVGDGSITLGTTTLRDKDNYDIDHTSGNGCMVTVNPIQLTSIVVLPETMTLFEGGETDTITSITIHYNNGDTAIIALGDCNYNSDTTAVATVNTSGEITAIDVGTATITVSFTEGGITKTDIVEITVIPVPNLKLTPSTQSVGVNDFGTVNVIVEDATDLRGVNISLNFDASKLQYSSSSNGDFIPNDTLQVISIDNTNGSVTLDIAGLGTSGYHRGTGTGTIMIVIFERIATSNTNITFGTTQLRDKDNNTINHTTGSGCLLTNLLGDFGGPNGSPDCIVDFEDLMIFALAYGSTPSDANWNPVCDIAGPGGPTPDGVIDFEDLMVFAMHYGETCADL